MSINLRRSKSRGSEGRWAWGRPIGPFLIIGAVWTVLWIAMRPPLATFPSPQAVLGSFWDLIRDGTLMKDILASLGRIGLASLFSIATGLTLGLMAGVYRRLGEFLEPLSVFFMGLDGVVWIPLALIWFGIGTTMFVFIIWQSMVFLIFANVVLGVRSVPPTLVAGVETLGGKRRHVILHVLLPGAMPHIMSGVRSSLGFGWRALIVGEIIGAASGLGHLIFQAKEFLRTDVILVGIITIGMIWILIDSLVLAKIERVTIERWGLMSTGGE
jgi:taurine transport system permease protein